MPVIPLVLVIAGYWVMYAGVKKVSLGDAFMCKAQVQQTPVPEPSNVHMAPAAGVARPNPLPNPVPNPQLVPGLLPNPQPVPVPLPAQRVPWPAPAPQPGIFGEIGSWLNGILGRVGL